MRLRIGVTSISIHALREEGDIPMELTGYTEDISIHALREEGDAASIRRTTGWSTFLSTPSARRATDSCHAGAAAPHISIHALREEGDDTAYFHDYVFHDFYPRPPRGGRRGS